MPRHREQPSLVIYFVFFCYVTVSLTYQIVAAVSLTVGFLNLRQQVRAPFVMDVEKAVVSHIRADGAKAGLSIGDRVERLNGVPYTGRAQWHHDRWYAHIGEVVELDVVKADGRRASISVPLTGYEDSALEIEAYSRNRIDHASLLAFTSVVVPLFCLVLGYWVVLSRPTDLNAWLILILLTYPVIFISVPTYNWLPGEWLVLRLTWHLLVIIAAPCALLWFGLLFPERSSMDRRLPWLKWLVLGLYAIGLAVGLAGDYGSWYDNAFYTNYLTAVEPAMGKLMSGLGIVCVIIYWVALFLNLRHASSADKYRRLRILWAGSLVGLGSILIIFGLLPALGISNPSNLKWISYFSAILMLSFPLSLAYVVIAERALDFHVLLRVGTRYALARMVFAIVEIALVATVALQLMGPALSGERRFGPLPIALVGAAVLIAVVSFRSKTRDRIQSWIDRRFFREQYNAELVLSQLAERARLIQDPKQLMETICTRISEVLHIPQIAVLLRTGSAFQLQYALGLDTTEAMMLPETALPLRSLESSDRVTIVDSPMDGDTPSNTESDGEAALRRINTEVLLPIPGRTQLMGVISLGPKLSEEAYTPNDLRLLQAVGIQTGFALEVNSLARSLADQAAQNARIQREVEIAREVQQRLFPQTMPNIAGIEIAGCCRPAMAIGGDYYDLIEMEGGRLGLAIGDVSGKGISAALLMATLRASLRGLAAESSLDLATLMGRLNRVILESSEVNRYATFFFAIYHPATRKLRYVNAGHNVPLVMRSSKDNGRVMIRLDAGGPVIGLLPNAAYTEQTILLEPADILFAYTDGISEAMTPDDDEWGEDRMVEACLKVSSQPPSQMIDLVIKAADSFANGAEQHDDMTLLIMRLS